MVELAGLDLLPALQALLRKQSDARKVAASAPDLLALLSAAQKQAETLR